MMLTPHLLAGAALATLMPESAVGKAGAFGVGVVSHYALDALPHWERLFTPHYNDRLPKDHKKWPNHILIQGASDALIAVLLLRYFSFQHPGPLAINIYLGGLGGVLPDIVDNTPWWSRLTKKVPLWALSERLHRKVHMSYKRQRQLPHYTGLLTQCTTAAAAAIVLLRAA